MILGLDPGEHCVVAATGGQVGVAKHGIRRQPVYYIKTFEQFCASRPSHPICETLIVEGQDIRKARSGPGVRKQNILKLAMRAGIQTCRVWDMAYRPVVAQLPVKVWKDLVCPGGALVPKEVFCNRIFMALTDEEKRMVNALGDKLYLDALDSIGLSWAGHLVNIKPYLLGKKDGLI